MIRIKEACITTIIFPLPLTLLTKFIKTFEFKLILFTIEYATIDDASK
jgi:hypothetical protein